MRLAFEWVDGSKAGGPPLPHVGASHPPTPTHPPRMRTERKNEEERRIPSHCLTLSWDIGLPPLDGNYTARPPGPPAWGQQIVGLLSFHNFRANFL